MALTDNAGECNALIIHVIFLPEIQGVYEPKAKQFQVGVE
jgi:hypothetical protein